MLHSLKYVVDVPALSRASPLPQGSPVFTHNVVITRILVGAGLPAKGPSAPTKISSFGECRQIPGQPQRLTHEQRLGFGHLVDHL
jgi:hypothetical protein